MINKDEFKRLEDSVYECLYEQEIPEIEYCKYFMRGTCKVCNEYIKAVEELYPNDEN